MIQIFDSMTELLESVPKENMTFEMCNAFVKAWGKIHGYGGGKSEVHPFTMYPKIMVSVSGGADSDIVLDLVERIGYPLSEVHYAFFDTGLEFAATKRHLEYLEQKYGITIERYRAKIPVPLGVKKYGVPFLSKKISNNRLCHCDADVYISYSCQCGYTRSLSHIQLGRYNKTRSC